MIQNSEITGHYLILQDGPCRDVNPVPVVGDDDDGPPEADPSPEGDVPGHCQMVQLQHVWYRPKSGEKRGNLLKISSELQQLCTALRRANARAVLSRGGDFADPCSAAVADAAALLDSD